jgi:23S rRNA (guanosine2251-2'-O)-methyltransferase
MSPPAAVPSPPPSSPQPRIYALLDGIRSAWNVGSMFRTADAAGLAGLYLCGVTPTPPRPDLEKTALGASLTVPWTYWDDSIAAVNHLRAQSIQVVALELTPTARPYDHPFYRSPVCFVVGHELRGVRPEVLALADDTVAIPMWGIKHSLNVAVSFGIMAYGVRAALADGRRTG